MAYKPVYLEPDEEITSVIDKISNSPDSQVALVLAKNSGLFQSLVNLKLLAKEAKRTGKSVILITSNKVGQRLAGQVGITTYGSLGAISTDGPTSTTPKPTVPVQPDEVIDGVKIKQYNPDRPTGETAGDDNLEEELAKDDLPAEQTNETPKELDSPTPEKESVEPFAPVHEKPSPQPANELPAIVSRGGFKQTKEFKIPWKSVGIGAGIFLFLILLASIFIPRAVVTVAFPATPLSEKLTVSAVSGQTDTQQVGVIAGNKLTTEKTKTDTVKATGKKDVGTKSTGSVTITNKYTDSGGVGRDQTFSAGTKVTHTASGKVFTLNSSVTVGRVTYNPGNGQPIYQSKTVAVTASEPGEDYNVSAGNFSIAGALSNTPVSSSTAFSGGLTKEITVLSQDDIDGALLKLRKAAREEALAELTEKAQGQKILDDAIWEDVKDESTESDVGAEVDSTTARVDVDFGVIAFDETVATDLFKAEFNNKITDSEEVVFDDNNPPTFTAKDSAKDHDRLKFEISGQAYKVPKIDKNKLAKEITKKNQATVTDLLKNVYKAEEVNIVLSPGWWVDRMPFLASEIRIEYGFNNQSSQTDTEKKQ